MSFRAFFDKAGDNLIVALFFAAIILLGFFLIWWFFIAATIEHNSWYKHDLMMGIAGRVDEIKFIPKLKELSPLLRKFLLKGLDSNEMLEAIEKLSEPLSTEYRAPLDYISSHKELTLKALRGEITSEDIAPINVALFPIKFIPIFWGIFGIFGAFSILFVKDILFIKRVFFSALFREKWGIIFGIIFLPGVVIVEILLLGLMLISFVLPIVEKAKNNEEKRKREVQEIRNTWDSLNSPENLRKSLANFVTFKKRKLQKKVERIEERLNDLDEERKKLKEKEKSLWKELERAKNQLKEFNPELAVDEVRRILNYPGIKAVKIDESGRISFYTDKIEVEFRGRKYTLGYFRIDISDESIRIYNLTRKVKETLDHPHIAEGVPCWGSARYVIGKNLIEGNYLALIQLILHFLKSVNPGGWYESIYAWG